MAPTRMVAMRDGVRLATDIHLPAGAMRSEPGVGCGWKSTNATSVTLAFAANLC